MKFVPTNPPRAFHPGSGLVTLIDTAHIELAPDEQITIKTGSGAEYDVARKDWGFYATPSVNSRLPRFGLRAALVSNKLEQVFVHLVEQGKEQAHAVYLKDDGQTFICWLDDAAAIKKLLPDTHL